ncbi:winged helix-turn-helix domain-containing protein [Bradyrhizobium cenepequi]|uniref:winged helix-turn-helix domain-containing protein n=1 Tax=Bradyrhizobium cenepequi TaxID=2821403 RepID=UPI001CE30C34|nr:helix-turn-helix domain-containing protein [Bradyrhizobium cenepequi]MCA6108150.1 winged helix-turn-helix domain-containing protein [Bradyrhizobium cenepequi]
MSNEKQILCPCCGQSMHLGDGLSWSPDTRQLLGTSYSTRLTPSEATIFDVLWKSAKNGRVVTREKLFDALYWNDPNGGPDWKTVDVLLCKLRKKIESSNVEVITVWKEGYFLRVRLEPGEMLPRRKYSVSEVHHNA